MLLVNIAIEKVLLPRVEIVKTGMYVQLGLSMPQVLIYALSIPIALLVLLIVVQQEHITHLRVYRNLVNVSNVLQVHTVLVLQQ